MLSTAETPVERYGRACMCVGACGRACVHVRVHVRVRGRACVCVGVCPLARCAGVGSRRSRALRPYHPTDRGGDPGVWAREGAGVVPKKEAPPAKI